MKNQNTIVSLVDNSNNTLVETLFSPVTGKNTFAICTNGEISTASNFGEYKPPSGTGSMFKNKTVLLPSAYTPYENELELFNEVKAFIHKYVDVPPEFESVASLYVMLTWVFDRYRALCYLRVIGDAGCGKTRFLKTIGALCYHSFATSGASSTPVIFRMLDKIKGTLILDESDVTDSSTRSDFATILNQGNTYGTPVCRCGQDDFDPESFDVFGPKIIASREMFQDDALESRCLTQIMLGSERTDIPPNEDDEFWAESERLRNKLLMFRFRNWHKVGDVHNVQRPAGISNRVFQVTVALMSLAYTPEIEQAVMTFIGQQQASLLDEKQNSIDGILFQSLISCRAKSDAVTCKDICTEAESLYPDDILPSYRKVGAIVKNQFGLTTRHVSRGNVIDFTDIKNQKQFERIKQRYGLDVTEPEISTEENQPAEVNNWPSDYQPGFSEIEQDPFDI